jgi:hypothetical protein
MKVKLFIPFLLASTVLLGANLNGEDSNEEVIRSTIELARSYLGDSDKLDSIDSIHYRGSLLYSTGDLGTIEMVYQKPMRQMMIAVVNNRKEVSVLDGSEGWTTYENVGTGMPLGMEIFDPIRILIMQSAVREAFAFYKKPIVRDGGIFYDGKESVKGHECIVLTYEHGDGIAYRRYIDAETGQLRKTLDSKGVEYFEEGEILVDGIRFPKKMVSTFATALGGQTMEFSYNSIKLNKKLSDSDFKMPLAGGL